MGWLSSSNKRAFAEKLLKDIRAREEKDKIDIIGEVSPEIQEKRTSQNLQEKNSEKMRELRGEREKEDEKQEGQLLAIHGAKIKFNSHMGEFKVLSDVPTTQGKLTGTIVEKQIPNFTFYDGFQMLSLAEWQDFGTVNIQDNFALLKKSILPGTGKMQGNVPPENGKIEFVDSGQVNVPEELNTVGRPLPENLDDRYLLSVYYNDSKIEAESFVFISATPTMPKIKIEIYIGKDCKYKSLRFRLKTEFKFKASATLYDRNDVDYFPSKYDGGNAFVIANTGKTNWDVDFRGLYRGGTATVEIWNEEKTSILNTFKFYIRGKNPTKETVKKYMSDMGYLKYWPVYRMILHESGSEFYPVVRQFWDPEFAGKGKNRKEVIYGPSGRMFESKGIPNYGEPDGWGMCQIDFTYEKREKKDMDYITKINKNPNYIWNWKENMSIKMNKKISDKLNAAKTHLEKLLKNSKYIVKPAEQIEGKLTYRWCPTTIPELSHLNKYMPQKADNSSIKSFLDAEFIKLYNGGHYVTDINNNGVATFKNYEEYKDIKISYVEKIGNINE